MLLIIILVAVVLLVCLGIFGFFYVQVKNREHPDPAELHDQSEGTLGTCVKCQQRRIIINKDAGLCAFCWSSSGTKQLS